MVKIKTNHFGLEPNYLFDNQLITLNMVMKFIF